jgi:hypothetical protein
MDWEFLFKSVLTPFLISYLVMYLYRRYSKKRRIYCNDEGWLPIATFKQDESHENLHEELKDFLITDGNKIKVAYSIDYDSKGKVYMCKYSKIYATHWRPMPMPPLTQRKNDGK